MSKVVVVRCPDCGVECAVMVTRGLRGVQVRRVTACSCAEPPSPPDSGLDLANITGRRQRVTIK